MTTAVIDNTSSDNLFANALAQSIECIPGLNGRSRILKNGAVAGFGLGQFMATLDLDDDTCCHQVVEVCLPECCCPPPPPTPCCCDPW